MESKMIYLAGGCFWGTEKYLSQIKGVCKTEVGFANGTTEAPTYEEVCKNHTGHAETVKVEYDPQQLPLEKLLDYYYEAVNPTAVNKQGNDVGVQYRTGIYYVNPDEETTIRQSLEHLQEKIGKPVAIECCPLQNYYPAEEYHQNYLDKNPTGYCHLNPALFEQAYEESRK